MVEINQRVASYALYIISIIVTIIQSYNNIFFLLSTIVLYAICTGYTVVQSTKQVCTQIREIKEYNINNIIILMP